MAMYTQQLSRKGMPMPMLYFYINIVPVTVTAVALGWIIGDLVW